MEETSSSTQKRNLRLNKLAKQFIAYFGVALVGLIFDFGTLTFLHEVLGVHYLIAAIGGFIVGLAINYILSVRYVFKDSKLKSRTLEFGLFGVIGLIGLGILSLMMWFMTDVIHLHYIFSKCFATVAVYMWNFFARKGLYRN